MVGEIGEIAGVSIQGVVISLQSFALVYSQGIKPLYPLCLIHQVQGWVYI